MIDTLDIQINKIVNSRLNQVDFDNILFARIYSDHMFVADYLEKEWQDYRVVPFGDLKLSPATLALHYGQSIFEGLKAYKSPEDDVLIFRPLDNFKRINRSAERLVIPQVSEELFMGALTELLRLDSDWVPDRPGTSLYIRPFIFATDDFIGVRPGSRFKFMIITCPVGAYYSTPVKVKIETKFTRASRGGTGYAKAAGNYAGSLYPAKLAQDAGYHQLIWTDGKEHKYIEESGTMNIMFVIGDKLVTPQLSDSILAGITRDSILTLARESGMEVEERLVTIDEIVSSARNGELKEAFGVGTAATIAQIELIGYEGEDYILPPIEEREFSPNMLKTLDDIRTGRVEDTHDWVFRV